MGKNRLTISVIVPVYNASEFLEECIQSLTDQVYTPVEIILIDDGSTDGSGEICDAYAAKYDLIQVIHKKNSGVSAARNVGIDRAKGDYLVFVDADDCAHSCLLRSYAACFSENRVVMCSFDVTQTSIDVFDEKEEPEQIRECSVHEFMELFYKDYINVPWNKLYSSKLLNEHQIRFPEGISLGEDLIFNLEYLKYAPKEYRIITNARYYYRENTEGSLSSSFRMDLFEHQLYMFHKLRNFLQDMDVMRGSSKMIYLRLFWDRLYLTLRIYREYGKEKNIAEIQNKLREILRHPIWNSLWSECRREKIITLKMVAKRIRINIYKLRLK